MKTAHWSKVRLELHARRERLTTSLAKSSGPVTEKKVAVRLLTTEEGHPIIRNGEPVEVVEEIPMLTPRGKLLVSLGILDASRKALLRAAR